MDINKHINAAIASVLYNNGDIRDTTPKRRMAVSIPGKMHLGSHIFHALSDELVDCTRRFFKSSTGGHVPISTIIATHLNRPVAIALASSRNGINCNRASFVMRTTHGHTLSRTNIHGRLSHLNAARCFLGDLVFRRSRGIVIPVDRVGRTHHVTYRTLSTTHLGTFTPTHATIRDFDRRLIPRTRGTGRRRSILMIRYSDVRGIGTTLRTNTRHVLFNNSYFGRRLPSRTSCTGTTGLIHGTNHRLTFTAPHVVGRTRLTCFSGLFAL